MASNTVRPHWNTLNHDRTEQFGFHGIARKADFPKSDVGVVPTLAQHVLCGRFHGNHAFSGQTIEIDKKCYNSETNRHRRMIEAWIPMFSGMPNPNILLPNSYLVAMATIF